MALLDVEDHSPSLAVPAFTASTSSQALSLRTAVRHHPLSPKAVRSSLRDRSRRSSLSPLSFKQSLLLSGSVNPPKIDDTMLVPGSLQKTPKKQTYIPLCVRNSTLFPFSLSFDPSKTMETLSNKSTAFSDSLTNRLSQEHHQFDPTSSLPGLLSDKDKILIAPNKGSSGNKPHDNAKDPLTGQTKEATTPKRAAATTELALEMGLLGHDSLTAPVTPSKNSLGVLVREMQAKTVGVGLENHSASAGQTRVRQSPHRVCTPTKLNGAVQSAKSGLLGLLSPRSTRSNKESSAAEFLGTRTPPKSANMGKNEELIGHLEFLLTQPPPDINQHPLMAADPFTSRSNAPSISSFLTVAQTRQWAMEYYKDKRDRWNEKQVGPFIKGEPFPVFKQPPWIADEEEPSSDRLSGTTRAASYSSTQELRASQSPPLHCESVAPKTPLSINTRLANTPTADPHVATRSATPITDEPPKKPGSAGIRSFSNIFRSRTSSDRSSVNSGCHDVVSSQEKPEDSRSRKERYLRTITNCPTFDYNPTSVFPRHLNTGRDWRSRNLRCAGCQWITCAICGRACCARAACFYAIETHKESPESLRRAREVKEMIERVMPTDTEVQTFLKCTSCMKEICPDCCGMCPNEACQDIQCRQCKAGDPWDECDWHRDMTRPRS